MTLISAFVTTEKIEDIQDGEYDAVISSGMITTGLVRPSDSQGVGLRTADNKSSLCS